MKPKTQEGEDWAIFKISNGQKGFVIKLDPIGGFNEIHYKVKASSPEVLKFSFIKAKKLIKKNIYVGSKMGVVNSTGIQYVFDWRVKFDDESLETPKI